MNLLLPLWRVEDENNPNNCCDTVKNESTQNCDRGPNFSGSDHRDAEEDRGKPENVADGRPHHGHPWVTPHKDDVLQTPVKATKGSISEEVHELTVYAVQLIFVLFEGNTA